MSILPLAPGPTTTFIQACPHCYGFQVPPAGLLLRSFWSALPETSLHYVICYPGACFGSELFSKQIYGFVPDIKALQDQVPTDTAALVPLLLVSILSIPETPARAWDKRRGR